MSSGFRGFTDWGSYSFGPRWLEKLRMILVVTELKGSRYHAGSQPGISSWVSIECARVWKTAAFFDTL